MSEPLDMVDHLVHAAKMGFKDGMTKEIFMNNAEVFWDSTSLVFGSLSERKEALIAQEASK